LEVWYELPDVQLSPLVQFCASSFPQALITTVENLIIVGSHFSRPGQDGGDPNLWREVIQPFTSVKNLYMFKAITPHIASVLQGLVGESVMELLPALQNIFMKELRRVPEGIEQFVATRQLAGHPVSVSRWGH